MVLGMWEIVKLDWDEVWGWVIDVFVRIAWRSKYQMEHARYRMFRYMFGVKWYDIMATKNSIIVTLFCCPDAGRPNCGR